MLYKIDTAESYQEFVEYIKDHPEWNINNPNLELWLSENPYIELLDGNQYKIEFTPKTIVNIRQNPEKISHKYDPVIFGKDSTENIVSVVAEDSTIFIYKEVGGKVETEVRKFKPYLISAVKPYHNYKVLAGNLHYKYYKEFDTFEDYQKCKGMCYGRGFEFYSVTDQAESYMAISGVTYFKGMKLEDVSVLSFDIESSGLHADAKDAKTYLISNTLRRNGEYIKKLFSIDEYRYEDDMILAWVKWVREMNPSVICGHNIYAFDLPYLNLRMNILTQKGLELGRDGSEITFADKASHKRKDGSQEYDYFKVRIHGREIIDTWFLSINYDNVRKQYPSLGLKQIIKFEYEHALELGDKMSDLQKRLCDLQSRRQFYDAGTIKDNWSDLTERAKIKQYCENDADEALYLYDLMVPPYFYMAQSIPKLFQAMIESATGTQINSLMVRNYLQEGYSLPRADEQQEYTGAISFGIPGVYRNGFKIDFASLYPSIMLQYEVCDIHKDPKKYFLKLVNYFTHERLENKQKAKETGIQYYLDLSEAQKILINSMYGFLGSKGLVFNSPKWAAFITQKGRELLDFTSQWATGQSVYEWKKLIEEESEEEDENT